MQDSAIDKNHQYLIRLSSSATSAIVIASFLISFMLTLLILIGFSKLVPSSRTFLEESDATWIIVACTFFLVSGFTAYYLNKIFLNHVSQLINYLDKVPSELLRTVDEWKIITIGATGAAISISKPLNPELANELLNYQLIYFDKCVENKKYYKAQKWLVVVKLHEKNTLKEYIDGRTAKL